MQNSIAPLSISWACCVGGHLTVLHPCIWECSCARGGSRIDDTLAKKLEMLDKEEMEICTVPYPLSEGPVSVLLLGPGR